ncbi:MAG: phosphotransferase [Sphingobium sp.]
MDSPGLAGHDATLDIMINPTFHSSIGEDIAAQLLGRHYGIVGAIDRLTAERDCNFHVMPEGARPSDAIIFKVFGLSTHADEPGLLAAILAFLAEAAPALPVPRLRPDQQGAAIISFRDQADHARWAIAYSYLPGTPLFAVERTLLQARQCGGLLAGLARALAQFHHPAMHRDLIWDLRQVPRLRTLLPQIDDLPFAGFVHSFLDLFDRDVAPRLALVPLQFVHNDFNARNIIVDTVDPSRVIGIIDFGDALHTARIADVAVGVIGQITTLDTARQAMNEFVAAYEAINPLSAEDTALLPAMVAARIVQNVVMTSWHRTRNPAGDHFAAFGPSYFEERVEFAKYLVAGIDDVKSR